MKDLNAEFIPVLEDGDFRLTESSAILKYLADKLKSPAYPTDLRARARVNERMDWINTQIGRDFAYGFIYPQILPTHKRPSDEAQSATIAWGRERAKTWLAVLDQHLLGSKNRYLCGSQITIADYFAAPFVALGEAVGCDFSAFPNVARWLSEMKKLRSWHKVNEVFHGFAASLKDSKFVTL
jgi:glutathione S-transferase